MHTQKAKFTKMQKTANKVTRMKQENADQNVASQMVINVGFFVC